MREELSRSAADSRMLATTAALVLLVLSAPPARAGKDKKIPPVDTSGLVWPLPPEKPRVKYLEEFDNNYDIEPRKKRSLIDKMVGNPDPNKVERFMRPAGVAADSKGRIIVAAAQQATVYVIDKEHKELKRISAERGIALKSPIGVGVDAKDNIFVSDPMLHMVLKFNPEGHLVGSMGAEEGMKNPTFLAIDEVRRRIYVVDGHLHQVLVYNLDTMQYLSRFGKRGTKNGEFNFPVGVAVNPGTGEVAVTDTGSCSVQLFTSEFKFLRRFGDRGVRPGEFTRPKGLAYDSEGNIWVVDAAFANVQIFNPKGVVLMPFGNWGNTPGTFNLPMGIFIDKNDRVYVTDGLNHRVQVFQFLGGK